MMQNYLKLVNKTCARRYLSSLVKDLPDHKALIVNTFGEPTENVILKISKPQDILPDKLEPQQILVKHLAATVNPADINLIQGVYGIKPPLPFVVGNEGIARVLDVGSDINHLKPDDLTLGVSTLGYWQSYSVQNGNTFYKIDNSLDREAACQLKVNPCTAYRMMKDYCHMKPNDVMIQNGANSAVGVYAIQLAKHWGIRTINVIRDRKNKAEIIRELKDYGADFVVTEEEIRDMAVMTPILEQVGKPKLLLNCVSGKNAVSCHRILDDNGFSVTYGFMSKQPLMIGAKSMFIDHQIKLFWMSRWYHRKELEKRGEICDMLNEVSSMFKTGVLKPKNSTLISFEERNKAFFASNNTKYVFSINE